MANSITHAGLPYPIKGARYTIEVPYVDGTGTPTDPTTPDTERSVDGAAFADCTEEVTTISGSNGFGYITLTGDELDCSLLVLAAKAASGPKSTLMSLRPRNLPTLMSGTAAAGAAGSITLQSGAANRPECDDILIGCYVRTTGGTGGGGGSGKANNQVRQITDYVASTGVASVSPNWETNPDNTTTYEILVPEGHPALIMLLPLAEAVQGAPPAIPKWHEWLRWLWAAWRNQGTVSSTEQKIRNDSGTVLAKRSLSDASGTFTGDEWVSGP